MRLVLATRNPHKLGELRGLLAPHEVVPLPDGLDLPPETGSTFRENALAKARAAAALTGSVAVADDSGIEAEALGGGPGVRSARWAAGDEAGRMLAALEGVPAERRRARYVCELVAVSPDGEEVRGTGVLEGAIAVERSGEGGFGFDPVFVPDGDARTVAELGDDWKRVNSHRARAARALVEQVSRR